ncbi:MAG TPA: PIG-L family deacetylase, partial [Verrucomicrobiae bacterium]|nr:PIG-L family deacetylase [Verrucomicrobiae bacterium]
MRTLLFRRLARVGPVLAALLCIHQARAINPPPDDGKLRIVCFGAHPDDCELQASGTAAMWAAKGHHVLFVSVSNGDIGHWREAGGPLALRRNAEVEAAHKLLGIEGEILDIHDGEVMPT